MEFSTSPATDSVRDTPVNFDPFATVTHPRLVRIDELADEIGELAGYLNAANCRFLELIAEFDELGGYAAQGAASCAHWLNWRCGIGLNAAREKVRTARALTGLPQIHASFAAGRLSYSKVRAMTRVATPENEGYLLDIALHGTASHVEKLVRGYRWRIRHDDERAEDNKRIQNRYCHYHWDDDGSLVIEARLTPEQGAVVLKALQAGEDLAEELSGSEDEQERAGNRGGNTDVTAETSRCGVTADPDRPGSPAGIQDDVTAETPPAAAMAWHARRPQRRADALALLAESFLAHGPAALNGGDRHQVVLIADAGVLAGHGEAGACRLEGGPGLGVETMRRLACDAVVRPLLVDEAGEPVSIGRKRRSIPAPMRRALLLRDGGCRFPGCDRDRFVDGHHIVHWADGGETSLENLVTLCRFHHRLMHEEGFGVARVGANRFEFKSPRGNVIPPAAPPPDRVVTPRFDAPIDSETSACRWDGGPMDYCLAVEALQDADGRVTH